MEDYKDFENKFSYVKTAVQRAKQILKGSKKLVTIKAQNSLTVALEEIKQGLVTPKNIDTLMQDNIFFTDIDGELPRQEVIIKKEIKENILLGTDTEDTEPDKKKK